MAHATVLIHMSAPSPIPSFETLISYRQANIKTRGSPSKTPGQSSSPTHLPLLGEEKKTQIVMPRPSLFLSHGQKTPKSWKLEKRQIPAKKAVNGDSCKVFFKSDKTSSCVLT